MRTPMRDSQAYVYTGKRRTGLVAHASGTNLCIQMIYETHMKRQVPLVGVFERQATKWPPPSGLLLLGV